MTHDPSSYVGQQAGWCQCDQPSGQPGHACESCEGLILEPVDRMRKHLEVKMASALMLPPGVIGEAIERAIRKPLGFTHVRVGNRCQHVLCCCSELDGLPLGSLDHGPPFHEECDCWMEGPDG